MLILRTRSLRKKLYEPGKSDEQDEDLEAFIRDLLSKPEVPIKGAAHSRMGKTITQLLHHQKVESYLNFFFASSKFIFIIIERLRFLIQRSSRDLHSFQSSCSSGNSVIQILTSRD